MHETMVCPGWLWIFTVQINLRFSLPCYLLIGDSLSAYEIRLQFFRFHGYVVYWMGWDPQERLICDRCGPVKVEFRHLRF